MCRMFISPLQYDHLCTNLFDEKKKRKKTEVKTRTMAVVETVVLVDLNRQNFPKILNFEDEISRTEPLRP